MDYEAQELSRNKHFNTKYTHHFEEDRKSDSDPGSHERLHSEDLKWPAIYWKAKKKKDEWTGR